MSGAMWRRREGPTQGLHRAVGLAVYWRCAMIYMARTPRPVRRARGVSKSSDFARTI